MTRRENETRWWLLPSLNGHAEAGSEGLHGCLKAGTGGWNDSVWTGASRGDWNEGAHLSPLPWVYRRCMDCKHAPSAARMAKEPRSTSSPESCAPPDSSPIIHGRPVSRVYGEGGRLFLSCYQSTTAQHPHSREAWTGPFPPQCRSFYREVLPPHFSQVCGLRGPVSAGVVGQRLLITSSVTPPSPPLVPATDIAIPSIERGA